MMLRIELFNLQQICKKNIVFGLYYEQTNINNNDVNSSQSQTRETSIINEGQNDNQNNNNIQNSNNVNPIPKNNFFIIKDNNNSNGNQINNFFNNANNNLQFNNQNAQIQNLLNNMNNLNNNNFLNNLNNNMNNNVGPVPQNKNIFDNKKSRK